MREGSSIKLDEPSFERKLRGMGTWEEEEKPKKESLQGEIERNRKAQEGSSIPSILRELKEEGEKGEGERRQVANGRRK